MPVLWTHGVGTGRLTMNEFVAVVSDDNGEKRLYPSVNFVTLDVWRQMQLDKLL